MSPKHIERRAALVSLAALALSGCVVVPAGPRHPYPGAPQSAPPPDGPVVSQAPPEPRYEVVGVAPEVGMIWLAGFWWWASGGWTWRPGHWEHPRPGHHWVPHRWERGGGGWYYRPGHWQRR